MPSTVVRKSKKSLPRASYYTWKSKYGGMEVADLSLDHKVLKDIVEKKL